MNKNMESKSNNPAAEKDRISLSELLAQPPEAENSNDLFANGWLRKGGGCILTAPTGVGKSVFSVQVACAWALGKECFGIQPLRPLNIAIIQSENDRKDTQEFCESMCKGFAENEHWSQDDITNAVKNVYWEDKRFIGKAGDEFCAALKEMQQKYDYDLIIVDPLQAYFGGDISKNQDVSHFLRQGIDPIIKNPSLGCGILFIHHTNKPSRDASGRRLGMDASSPYEGAGGAELANWQRAGLNIVKEKELGCFSLVATKRYQRLHWKTDEGEETNRKILAHSQDGISFWRELKGDEIPQRLRFACSASPAKPTIDPCQDAKELAKEVSLREPMKAGELRNYATGKFGKNRGCRALKELGANPTAYGLTSRRDAQRIIYTVVDEK